MSGVEYFSAFEVIRAAMEVEKNGRRFYLTMAERAVNPPARELFALLAEDEVEHLRRLQAIEARSPQPDYFADAGEFAPYLRQFGDERIFPAPALLDAVLKGADGERQALLLAIRAEEEFAAYFALAAEKARESDGRTAFAWLAGEERRHAELLRERLAAYPGAA